MARIFEISVRVTSDGIVVNPEVAVVYGDPVLLQFMLTVDPGLNPHRFAKNLAAQVVDPGESFPYSSWTLSDSMATLFNGNYKQGLHQYFLSVEELQVGGTEVTGKILTVDPMINNQ